jgi:clathrin heavy chain
MAEEQLARFLPPPKKGGGEHNCVVACWFQCYHLLHSNVILEMFWRHSIMDFGHTVTYPHHQRIQYK